MKTGADHEVLWRRVFKRTLGVSPRRYQDTRRLDCLRAELREGSSVTDAMHKAGFASSSRLYEKSTSHLGMTPGRYRARGQGLAIGYAIVRSPLGRVLVAATARGVCALLLGGSAQELERRLRSEFTAAALGRDERGLSQYTRGVAEYLDGHCAALDLPLDVQATVFQRRVWEMLRAIPRGETRSYGAIAQRLGKPRAARAVARACAANPVALVIPCHRAVAKDGGLAGYRWGVERKAALLALERAPLRRRAR